MIALLLAVLLAQPAAVEAKKPPAHGQSLADRAGRTLRRLVEKPEPHVTQGNARAAAGDADGALQAYEKAEVPEHGVAAAALAHDRASALLRSGDAHVAPEAVQEANRALLEGDAPLQAMGAYDLGYALEQSGRPDEAIEAYARALQLDPRDRDAKVNLELLLRQELRKEKQPNPMGKPDKDKKQQAGKDDQQKQSGKDEQRKDPQKQAGQDPQKQQTGQEKPEEQQQGQASQQAQPDKAGEKKELQAAANRPMDRSEAQRLLDALRAGEKNLQIWRFGKQKAKERRTDVEKDW